MGNALFLSVDKEMFVPALFTAHTARRNARAAFDTIIAVPENSIEPAWIDWAQANVGVTITEVNFAERIGVGGTADPNLPISTCYRHLFELFLPTHYSKLVYLDADIRVVADISVLFNLDLGSHCFAASPDTPIVSGALTPWLENYIVGLGWDRSVPYLNAGVLVINRDRWRKHCMRDRLLASFKTNFDACLLGDQSALNLLVRGAFQPISPVWNMFAWIWLTGEISDVISPAILHHTGKQKPWRAGIWRYDPTETQQYHQLFRKSPWPRFASIWGETPNWKTYRRYVKRWAQSRLIGKPAMVRHPACNITKYKDHIRSFAFADKAQGLVGFDANGVLRATGLQNAS